MVNGFAIFMIRRRIGNGLSTESFPLAVHLLKLEFLYIQRYLIVTTIITSLSKRTVVTVRGILLPYNLRN